MLLWPVLLESFATERRELLRYLNIPCLLLLLLLLSSLLLLLLLFLLFSCSISDDGNVDVKDKTGTRELKVNVD